jgi:hypothetical protein
MSAKHLYLSSMLAVIAALSLAGQQPKELATKLPANLALKNIEHKVNIVGGTEIKTAAKAEDLALPRARFPQIRFAQSNQFFAANKDRSKTPSGLYILDSDFIPEQLPEILSRAHLTLRPDGSLVNAQGGKATMVLWHKLVQYTAKRASLADHEKSWSLFPSVYAASPYPLSWVSAWGNWYADNGFCRSVTATTGADSWGPVQNGARPHTRIQFIETRAWSNGTSTIDHQCSNCDTLTSQAQASYGCWWPAYGFGVDGYADLKDGSFSWSWSW